MPLERGLGMKKRPALPLALAMALVLALALALASPAAFGVVGQQIVHRDLGIRSFSSPSYFYGGGVHTPRDAASGQSTGRADGVGGFIPGGPIISFIAENGEVKLGPASNPASASTVMTLPAGHVGQLDLTPTSLVVLEGVPATGMAGFVVWPHMHRFDSLTGERSFSTTIGPDVDPDLGGWAVGHLDADSDGDAVAFIVNSHATPGVDLAMFSPLESFVPSEVAQAPSIDGISLDTGRLAFNAAGSVHVALASKTATSFSWGVSQVGSGGGLGNGRAIGSPSLSGSTLAWTEAASGAARGDVFVADLNSGLTSQVSRADAATDVPGPALTDDAVYWARDGGSTYFDTPIGGTRKAFVLPHVLEKSGIRADDLSTSQVATLGTNPSPLSIGKTATLYTVGSSGARKVHGLHHGENSPPFSSYRLLPTVNKRGVTLSVSFGPGVNPSVPLSVVATRTGTGAGTGKISISDFNVMRSVPASGNVYQVTFDEVGQRTLFLFTFPGDGTFGSAESRLFEFAPTPAITIGIKPSAGPVAGSTFVISGQVVSPRPDVGLDNGTAHIVVERKTSKGWASALKTNPLYKDNGLAGENPFYASSKLKLGVRGTYRARASVAANDFHEAAHSPQLSFKVR